MKNLLTFLLLFASITAISQDKIIKKNSEIINCKVTEIAADEVKYYYSENSKLVFGIDKALVEKIEFATGEVIEIEDNTFKNPEYYANQGKRALKINFLSPLFGTTEFAYEQSIKSGKSWETALGIVGLGNDIADINPRGVYGKFAYKFIKSPDFYMNRMHYSHILKGAYFAPEIAVRIMSYDKNRWNDYNYYSSSVQKPTIEREDNFSVALMLKIGKQWIFDDVFLIDIYTGIGYGFGGDDYEGLPYGFIVAPNEFPIAMTSGIKIGWVFGK
ncbi:MAG: hypothetical protein HQ522_05215 [Bacteroidetes bacterium]|nr:hypothetical protein [Bacteroidota bacterium]